MKTKLKIPKGWYIARNGTRIHRGDRFKNLDGRWVATGDASRIIEHGGFPRYDSHPEYAGIYIRRAKPTPSTTQEQP